MTEQIEQCKEIVREQLELAKQRVERFLPSLDVLNDEQARLLIGTYRVAIEPNFIAWMYQAYQKTRSDLARKVLLQNIKDEIAQDHPLMLRNFSDSSKVELSPEHYKRASQPVLNMWSLFSKDNGLMNLAVAATLENTSLVFIPYLAELGKKLGCKDFTYTDVHGEADIKHARELYRGLVEEMEYGNAPWRTVATAVNRTIGFLEAMLKP